MWLKRMCCNHWRLASVHGAIQSSCVTTGLFYGFRQNWAEEGAVYAANEPAG